MSTTTTASDNNSTRLSLSDTYHNAIAMIDTNPRQAVDTLVSLQPTVATLFSQNEGLDELPTSTLPFVLLEHYLALAHVQLPTKGIEELPLRRDNLLRACDFWTAFFHNLQTLEVFSSQQSNNNGDTTTTTAASDWKAYETLVELTSLYSSTSNKDTDTTSPPPPLPTFLTDRTTKLARHHTQHTASQTIAKLQALRQRRIRLGIAETEPLDGYDDTESLERQLYLTQLRLAYSKGLDEWCSTLRELPLLSSSHIRMRQSGPPPPPPPPQRPMPVTHITQHPTTGQLQFRKQQDLRSQVFRPSWNLPTMSLDELAEREVRAARARDEQQQLADAAQSNQPRRYEQLVQEGLEDDAELVEQSAVLDRQWDDFKDANPRGSGNKRGDVGDRNF